MTALGRATIAFIETLNGRWDLFCFKEILIILHLLRILIGLNLRMKTRRWRPFQIHPLITNV